MRIIEHIPTQTERDKMKYKTGQLVKITKEWADSAEYKLRFFIISIDEKRGEYLICTPTVSSADYISTQTVDSAMIEAA